VNFFCYVDGIRFDSASLDISAGGAFLLTRDKLRIGQAVMVMPKKEKGRGLPIVLIGRVVRTQIGGENSGLGVQWLRCVSKNGLHNLFGFMEDYLETSPSVLPLPSREVVDAPVAAYDFVKNVLYVPNIPLVRVPRGSKLPDESGVPRSSDATPASPPTTILQDPALVSEETSTTMLTPPAYAKSDETGSMTQSLGTEGGRTPINVPVQFFVGDAILEGVVVSIGLSSLLLKTRFEVGESDARCVVAFPVPLRPEPTTVYLVCKVNGIEPSEEQAYRRLHLSISAVEQEQKPGLFERYVKFLYFRMHS